LLSGDPLRLAQHVQFRINSYRLVEERGELEEQLAGATAQIEQATAAAAAEHLEPSQELGRV